jgi:hypothetical protein
MPKLQDDRSTKNDWFEADCARRYTSQEPNEWDLRHVALSDWSVDWGSDGSGHSQSEYDCGPPSCDPLLITVHQVQFKFDRRRGSLRDRAEPYRVEFEALSRRWQRDTKHLSLTSKKITHPDFLRIIGMGEAVIPLLLESLRDRPAHWFAALGATANINPVPEDANPSQAREAWLSWGRSRGYID